MPETSEDFLQSAKSILHKAVVTENRPGESWTRKRWVPQDQIKQIVLAEGREFVGSGAEHIVIKRKGQSGEVIAFSFYELASPEVAKLIYYYHRAFSTLFPHNFPQIKASWTGEFSGQVRSEIVRSKSSTLILYPFSKVREVAARLQLPMYFDEGKPRENFIVGTDGGQYNLNILYALPPEGKVHEWHTDKILQYMDQNNYSDSDKYIVQKSIQRLSAFKGQKIITGRKV